MLPMEIKHLDQIDIYGLFATAAINSLDAFHFCLVSKKIKNNCKDYTSPLNDT